MSALTSHHLKAHGLYVTLTNFGASLADLRLEGHDTPLVLGFTNIQDYATHKSHMGATAGRVANRIAGGEICLEGRLYQLDKNEAGTTTLHGGASGCGTRLWDLEEASATKICFTLEDEDGHMGFPGHVQMRCLYEITSHHTLRISYHATTTRPTFVNLAHHSYFRLDKQDDISTHELEIMADHYLPVDEKNLPTGRIAPVAGTKFDFRQKRAIGPAPIDHNFCLHHAGSLRPVARLSSPASGIEMTLSSDQPGLQCYTAHHLAETAPNHHGRPYRAFDGICLEPQAWPNAPHMPDFPSICLMPGEIYKQTLILTFSEKGLGR